MPASGSLPRPLSLQQLPTDNQNSDPHSVDSPFQPSVTLSPPGWPSGLQKQASESSIPVKMAEMRENKRGGRGGGGGGGGEREVGNEQ